MNRSRWIALAAMLLLSPGARPAAAQLFTPSFLAPARAGDLGVYLSSGIADDGFAVEGIWRRGFGAYDLGLRAGVADVGDAALLVGAEYRNPLEIGTAPIDVSVTGGAQVVVGSESGLGVQAGATLGHTFVTPGLTVTPYLHPRLGLMDPIGAAEDVSLELLADLGVDLTVPAGLVVRVGLGFADETATLGIGLSWR